MALRQIKITKLDGSESVQSITGGVLIAFERQYKIGAPAAFSPDHMKIEYLYWLAWEAESRYNLANGGVRLLFDDWLKTVDDVDDVSTEDPTGGQPQS